MALSNQLTPGMVINISKKLYRVESAVKVTVPKGTPFIKTQLKNLTTGSEIEKNFKLDQQIDDVLMTERELEFLYPENKQFVFLDVKNFDQVFVDGKIIGDSINFLKEGLNLKASLYGNTVYSIELPQFLEIMVNATEGGIDKNVPAANITKTAILETGARITVPPFIEIGDIIKIDTLSGEFIQRV